MSEQSTIPEYGAVIRVEDSSTGFYLREKALDAIQEQVIADLSDALEPLRSRTVALETPWEDIHELRSELTQALECMNTAWEIAYAKRQEDDEA